MSRAWREWLSHAKTRHPDEEVRKLTYREWVAVLEAATSNHPEAGCRTECRMLGVAIADYERAQQCPYRNDEGHVYHRCPHCSPLPQEGRS